MNIRICSFMVAPAFKSAILWILIVAWQLPAEPHAQAQAVSQRARLVTHAVDVVPQWQPGQHLYVKGNLGASMEALDDLQRWIATNAPNWLVVLAEHADGETFTDSAGEVFNGVEAVNHALGKGLMNQTAFGQQTDPRTSERNAAFFLLFLKERQLSYYASEAQDRRGLGEESWIGNLDRAAIAAMRDGARVVDAVRDTIKLVNTSLDRKIVAEADARKKQEADQLAARNRAREQARAALANARAEYNLLEARSGELARRITIGEGDLARPDLPELLAALKLAQTAFEQEDMAAAQRYSESVLTRARQHVRRLDAYPADSDKLRALEQRLQNLKNHPYATAADNQIRAAQNLLSALQHEYKRADSSYLGLLDTTSQSVSSAAATVTMTERLAEQRRILWSICFFTAVLLLALLGLVLNRRRASAKTEARTLYDLWNKALTEKSSALFALLDRRATIVGTSVGEAAERFSGETFQLCDQIIREVDELFILLSCAGRVLQQANESVNPLAISAKLLNLFRRGPYLRGIGLLKDEPIIFRPEEGLELVVRGTRTERDRLIGSVSSYQPFTMTFNQLIETFNRHAERALNALDQIEASLLKAPEQLRAIQQKIDTARSAENAIRAESDALFRLAPVFGELLPSAGQVLSQAVAAGIQDPVGALRQLGSRALQQSDDAAALVAVGLRARNTTLPLAYKSIEALKASGLNPTWIQAELTDLSASADRAAMVALKDSSRAGITAFVLRIDDLENRCNDAVSLDEVRRGQAKDRMARSASIVTAARADIGDSLSLPADDVLREAGKDPSELLLQAEAQWQAAFTALDRGDLAAARNALDAVTALTAAADTTVAASLDALGKHQTFLASLQKDLADITAQIPNQMSILTGLIADYAPSALLLGAGDLTHPDANGTVTDNVQEAENLLTSTHELLTRSALVFRKAAVLEAADLLNQASALLDSARHRLAEIDGKKSRIETTQAANTDRLAGLERRAGECTLLAAQPSTMLPTVRAHEEAETALAEARAVIKSVPGDPFLAAAKIAAAEAKYESMAELARCDRDLFEQACRSLTAAENQLAAAMRLTTRSATDNIPDSKAIHDACSEVASLDDELRTLRRQQCSAHGDWPALDKAACHLATRAAAAAATLRGELDRAAAALDMLSTAASAVRSASGWIGNFGVSIIGSPGSDILSQAQSHLQRGEYDRAFALADRACAAAQRAIAQAEAEMARRRIAEEERIEQERRQRRAAAEARQSRSSSSSSFGSSRSSSWGSSGSGSRTSSFKSGSGTRTSSW